MRTNIVIDDKLIQQAMKATGIRNLRSKIKWEGNLDAMRTGRVGEN